MPKKTPKKPAAGTDEGEQSEDSDPDNWSAERLREEYKKLQIQERKQHSKSKDTIRRVDRKDRHLFSGCIKDTVWHGFEAEWWMKMEDECTKALVPHDYFIEEMSSAMIGAAARWYQSVRPRLLDVNRDNVTHQQCIDHFRKLFFDNYCGPNYAFKSFLQLLGMQYNSTDQPIGAYVAEFRSTLAQVNVVRSDSFGSSPEELGAIFYQGLEPQLQQKVYPEMILRQSPAHEKVIQITTAHGSGKEPTQAEPAFYSGRDQAALALYSGTLNRQGMSHGRLPAKSSRHGPSPGRPPDHLRPPFAMVPVIDNAGNVVSYQEVPPPNQPLPAPTKAFLAWRPGEEPEAGETYRMPYDHEDPNYYVRFEDTTHPPQC